MNKVPEKELDLGQSQRPKWRIHKGYKETYETKYRAADVWVRVGSLSF